MKICRRCKINPPRIDKASSGGIFYCESCFEEADKRRLLKARARSNEHRKSNKEKYNAAMRRYRSTQKYRRGAQARERKYQYGITEEQFRKMVYDQEGQCAICKEACPVDIGPPQKRLSVDYCHVTGRIRGLLCRRCNLAIGALRDDPILADVTAKYLRRYTQSPLLAMANG